MNRTYEIRSLEGTPQAVITDAFMNAFGDYNVQFSEAKLRDMLRRRGFDMRLSFGAFMDGRLVSFILNGIGTYAGAGLCAYDTGTGTVKECRGMGLTDRIFSYALPFLREAGVERYMLEVLQDNEPAVRIYTRQGFDIVRHYNCYAAGREEIHSPEAMAGRPALMIERAPAAEAAELAVRWSDSVPSWQNCLESVVRAGKAMEALVAYVDGEPAGAGVTEPAYGDLALIAVKPEFRRRGVGRTLLAAMMAICEPEVCRIVNVDAEDAAFNAFLSSCGFVLTCRQYEMTRAVG